MPGRNLLLWLARVSAFGTCAAQLRSDSTAEFVMAVKSFHRVEVTRSSGLEVRHDTGTTAHVSSIASLPLPKLTHKVTVWLDDATRARLNEIQVLRAARGLRLSLGDLSREALLRYLQQEEDALCETPNTTNSISSSAVSGSPS